MPRPQPSSSRLAESIRSGERRAILLRAVVVGGAWGVFCAVGNGWPVVTTLAQMAVPWIWVATVVAMGVDSPRMGALLGAISLSIANVVYSALGIAGRAVAGLPLTDGLEFFVLWTSLGLIVGPLAGIAGWRLHRRSKLLSTVVLLAAVSIAEPIALWAHIDHFDSHIAFLAVAIVGVVAPLIFIKDGTAKRFQAWALIFIIAYPAALALEAVLIGLGQISPPMRLI